MVSAALRLSSRHCCTWFSLPVPWGKRRVQLKEKRKLRGGKEAGIPEPLEPSKQQAVHGVRSSCLHSRLSEQPCATPPSPRKTRCPVRHPLADAQRLQQLDVLQVAVVWHRGGRAHASYKAVEQGGSDTWPARHADWHAGLAERAARAPAGGCSARATVSWPQRQQQSLHSRRAHRSPMRWQASRCAPPCLESRQTHPCCGEDRRHVARAREPRRASRESQRLKPRRRLAHLSCTPSRVAASRGNRHR